MTDVECSVRALRAGKPAVLVDDDGAAHLVLDAAAVTDSAVAFMASHSSGLLYTVLPAGRLDALALPAQASDRPGIGVEFSVTVDLRDGVTTGISAADRAATMRALSDHSVPAAAFHRPGHVLPVRAHNNGVLGQRDVYHAALDLVLEPGVSDCVTVAALVDHRGDLLLERGAHTFAARHGLTVLTVADVVAARRRQLPMREIGVAALANVRGHTCWVQLLTDVSDGSEHMVMRFGPFQELVLEDTQAHQHCWLSSLGGRPSCSCTSKLQASLNAAEDRGHGVVVVLATNVTGVVAGCGSARPVDPDVVARILATLNASGARSAVSVAS